MQAGALTLDAITEEAVAHVRGLKVLPSPEPIERPADPAPAKGTARLSLRRSSKEDREALRDLIGDGLTEDAMDELAGAEPALLKWVESSQKRAAIFLADPVRALRECGADVSPATVHALAAYRDELLAAVSLDDLRHLDSLSVKRRGKSREQEASA